MNFLYASLCGIIVSLMSIYNNQLSSLVGVYASTTIVHIVGLLTVIAFIIATKQSLKFNKETPILAYLGGCVGVCTTLFQIIATAQIGVASLTALSLFGQLLTSILIETYGLLGEKKQKLTINKIIGIILIAIGIGVMI